MSTNIKVVASGIIALCLALSALLYLQSLVNPSMQALGDRFFGLAVILILVVLVLAAVGVKVKLP
jgi:hypothetical protein